MSFDAKQAELRLLGYSVRFRRAEWTECLIHGHGESWLGRGPDDDEAFAHALSRALPTELSRRLFERMLGRSKRGEVEPPRPVIEIPSPPPRPVAEPAPLPEPPAVVSSAPMFPAPEPLPERSPGQIAVIISRPERSSIPQRPVSAMPEPAVPEGPARVFSDPDESLEELDILMDRVRDHREELGMCAPDRQRLAMLAWICEARAHTDGFPDDIRIRDRVGAISRLLTEIGKTFWPGSVTALQLHMQPRDLPRHLLGGVAGTWHRASELAEAALRNKEIEDERRGFDNYGWADAKMTLPRPADPNRVIGEVVAQVERISGLLDTQAAPQDANARPDPALFQTWVRSLRWTRGADVDPDRWARLAGRLRWWAFRRDPQLHQAARELEPSYVPPYGWASMLGQDPERRARDRQLRELFLGPPRPGIDRPGIIAWLEQVLQFDETHHGNIIEALRDVPDLVLELDPEELRDPERRVRRRFERVQAELKDGRSDSRPAPLPDSASETVELSAQNGVEHLPDGLLRKVRPITSGKRSALVSTRRDPDLQAKLQDAFGFATLDLKIAEKSRIEALGEAISGGQYDVVLSATGFQAQDVDSLLARACRQAGIQYVRVNRGRPMTCLRALSRGA